MPLGVQSIITFAFSIACVLLYVGVAPSLEKSSNFEYDWKKFFTEENSSLIEKKTTYNYKNPIDETDPIKWGYKTIWYGRRSRDYKCHPENLNIDNVNAKKNSDDNDEKSFESTHSTMGI